MFPAQFKPALPSISPGKHKSNLCRHLPLVLLVIALTLGLLLRLHGITWGLPTAAHPIFSYHPDEAPHIVIAYRLATDGAAAPHFIYGGTLYFRILSTFLPLGHLFESLLRGFGSIGNAILFGRLFMTVVALITILFIYRIGTLLFHRRVGALAALFLALVPAHIVWAQRVRPDELAAFLATVLFYLAVKVYQSRDHRRRYLYVAALITGVAVAFRFPLLLFAIPAGLSFLRRELEAGTDWQRIASPIALAAFCAIVGYLLGSPQSLLNPQLLLAGMRIQWGYQSHPFPPAIGHGPGLYQYGWTMMVMAVSYPIYLLAVGGAVVGVRRRDFAVILVLSALVPYLVLTSFTSWVVVRYLLPIVPFMILLAAYAVDLWLRRGPRPALAGAALGVTVLWLAVISFSYTRMETGTDVRDMATHWADRTIAAGTPVLKVVGYPGDFSSNCLLPKGIRGYVYSLKSAVDPAHMLGMLKPKYVFVGSQYLDELQRLGSRYPGRRPREFYRALMSGDYMLKTKITRPPTVMGMNLQSMFSSQDYRLANPTIYVFQRTHRGG